MINNFEEQVGFLVEEVAECLMEALLCGCVPLVESDQHLLEKYLERFREQYDELVKEWNNQ